MTQDDPRGVRPDLLFEALSLPQRRRILSLVGADVQREPADLARADENRRPSTEARYSSTERPPTDDSAVLLTDLQGSLFPKLAEAGYILWDRDRGVVRRGPRFAELEPFLTYLHETGAVDTEERTRRRSRESER